MATSTERIFRKVALERLSSPEQLDQLVPLTSPIGWAAVVAIAAILAAAIGWSIFGTLPTSVQGSGILVSRGGHVFDAMSPVSGTLITVADLGASEDGDPAADPHVSADGDGTCDVVVFAAWSVVGISDGDVFGDLGAVPDCDSLDGRYE